MITRGEDVEASALRQRGWSIAAIARHLGRDRKTVRAHLKGEWEAGVRKRSGPDRLGPFVAYLGARFADNAHIWATALYDEVVGLGYQGSYPSFVRQLRQAEWRPVPGLGELVFTTSVGRCPARTSPATSSGHSRPLAFHGCASTICELPAERCCSPPGSISPWSAAGSAIVASG